MTQEEEKFINLIKTICVIVNKNKHLDVSFKSLKYYGIAKYEDSKCYKITLEHNRGTVVFYINEEAFTNWHYVPCTGQERFKPKDFNEGPETKQLILAWCGCLYNFCTRYRSYEQPAPPLED